MQLTRSPAAAHRISKTKPLRLMNNSNVLEIWSMRTVFSGSVTFGTVAQSATCVEGVLSPLTRMALQKRFNDPRKQFVDPYWTINSGVLSHGRGRPILMLDRREMRGVRNTHPSRSRLGSHLE